VKGAPPVGTENSKPLIRSKAGQAVGASGEMQAEHYLTDVRRQLQKLKTLADRALAQIAEDRWLVTLDPDSNSVATIMKHMAGNMRSRWTDFLTSDGEKPDRDRDSEFVLEDTDTKESARKRWEAGWRLLFDALAPLKPEELTRTVQIRGEPHSVMEAINRQMTHYAYHVGQIVFLAKHFAGANWRSLSIPRGKSHELDVGKDGGIYRVRPTS